MRRDPLPLVLLALLALGAAGPCVVPPGLSPFTWSTVVNNGDFMPTDLCDPTAPGSTSPPCRSFNSYNQPSVNIGRLVVFRARSKGGQGIGEPVHGIYTRDMATRGPVVRLFDRDTLVPQPNNLDATLTEPPSFPRVDVTSDTVVSRGNHAPAWKVVDANGNTVTQLGTTGIYTNPFGRLIAGMSKLATVPDFSFFQVPEVPGALFGVFPGAPAVTDGNVIVFKGNYTEGVVPRTGDYYRELEDAPISLSDGTSLSPAGGTGPAVLIADSRDTLIPGTTTVFGSVAPPSAAGRLAVFAGVDDETRPTLGGIYLAPLLAGPEPPLTTLVRIGQRVPGENNRARFNKLGEGLSFDGRFVAFWGAWGTATKTLVLQCPTEGNMPRILYCNVAYPQGFAVQVPVHQGIFVEDIRTGQVRAVAKAPGDFDDFLYWNFSGHVPGGGEDDGEPAAWRSSAFAAVSGSGRAGLTDATFRAAFKARTGNVVAGAYVNPVDGIYLRRGPGAPPFFALVQTGMDGTLLDPEAVDPSTGFALPVTEMGIERDGFRGDTLVVNVTMGSEESGWAGIYLTEVRH